MNTKFVNLPMEEYIATLRLLEALKKDADILIRILYGTRGECETHDTLLTLLSTSRARLDGAKALCDVLQEQYKYMQNNMYKQEDAENV